MNHHLTKEQEKAINQLATMVRKQCGKPTKSPEQIIQEFKQGLMTPNQMRNLP